MLEATHLALLGCGAFFMTGLITGLWKYRGMITNADGQASAYVGICHRAALMYAFGCLVLAEFARLSEWPAAVNLVAVALPIVFLRPRSAATLRTGAVSLMRTRLWATESGLWVRPPSSRPFATRPMRPSGVL